MTFRKELGALLKKEFQLEWKSKYALNGLLMYALTMVFVISISFQRHMNPQVWNVIFWIILLFVAVNAIAKSFMGETKGQLLYLYSLASPLAIIMAKILYNCVLMTGISLITLLFYLWFSSVGGIVDPVQYVTIVIVGGWAFAANLTLVSAIAAGARNRTTLLAILGFPLLIPQLMSCILASGNALQGKPWAESMSSIIFSASLFVIIAFVSFILFPFLWRE